MKRIPIRKLVTSAMTIGFLLPTHTATAQSIQPTDAGSAYIHSLELDGVSIHAAVGVDKAYVEIAARVYQHMTSRIAPFDFRNLHDQSNFRILLINEGQKFSSLPEYKGQGTEIDQAAGLGGSIGEFFIGVQVGSPHTLVHELGHGLYHSAIQFQETGGEDDEEAWYSKRVQDVHGIGIEEAFDQFGEEVIHEVLLARKGTFSAQLGEAWNNAVENELWIDEYAGTEPNEYWAEGVAMWFRAWSDIDGDSREYLRHKDPPLYKLCASIFPDGDWSPEDALGEFAGVVPFSDEERRREEAEDSHSERSPNALVSLLDRNRDGKIGIFEGTESILAILSKADTDNDGFVQEHELDNYLEEWQHDGQDQHEDADSFEDELLEFLDEVDHDNDGAFSLLDVPESDREDIRPDFIELDRNDDGLVTKEELLALIDGDDEQSASFSIFGESGQRYATMNGVINASTPGRVLELYLEYPDIRRIEMLDVPGSMDDESNLRAARYIRKFGYTTHIPEGGMVASGGTDFFLAGTTRSAHPSAKFGVHSWGGGSLVAASLSRDHPAHRPYLEYYNEIGIPDEFYWFTLDAASADDIHWMTKDETVQFEFFTDSHADEPVNRKTDASDSPSQVATEPELIGDAVQPQPTQDVPDQTRMISSVIPSQISPFAKQATAFGIILAAEESTPDVFLTQIAQATQEIFRKTNLTDITKQDAVIESLYAYGAMLPVPRNERSLDRLISKNDDAFDRLHSTYSICDIIMYDVPDHQRVMEVVEHLLHTISDIGLHYTYPHEWGLSRDSALWDAMNRAIKLGYYDISGYQDLQHAPDSVADRILMQEFAYWFITTAWDLQVPYGPNEDEWTIRTSKELQEKCPKFYAIFQETAGRVIVKPLGKTLESFLQR